MKGLPFTEALAARGIDVTVVTGTPNYPSGNIYPGFKLRWHDRRQMGSTDVHIVPLYPSHDGNPAKRILNYVSFFFTGLVRMAILARRADVLYAYHPPLTVPLAAVIVGKLTRRPSIVEVQDLWPESLAATGMADHKWIIKAVDALARFVYRHADLLIGQSEGFRTAMIERGARAERVHVIYNWADESNLLDSNPLTKDLSRLAQPGVNEFHLLYAGNIGPAQNLSLLLIAADLLLRSGSQVRIHVMGSGQSRETLIEEAKLKGLTNVTFHDQQPRSEVGGFLADADALLVILKDDPLFRITVPSKTQTSLAAGRPIIMVVPGEASNLVQAAKAGVTVDPGDPKALADAIQEISLVSEAQLQQMGDSGRRYYLDHLSLAAGVDATAVLIRNAARQSARVFS
jgi:colanic acid biosynthesis glycosyl transferase WcaI